MTPEEKSTDETRSGESRPDESSGEPRFRERRSAFVEDDEDTRAPAPADPEEVRVGDRERPAGEADGDEPVIESAPGAERDTPVVGEAPAREAGADRAAATQADTTRADEIDLDRLDQMEIPEPSFLEVIQPLEIQALQFLGAAPLTESGEKRVLPRWAKHVIDLLGLLEERTRGNLPEEERQYLETVLTELRTRYLQVTE